jgi:hypothetical protein
MEKRLPKSPPQRGWRLLATLQVARRLDNFLNVLKGANPHTPALASQSYITLRLVSRKFITSSLTPSGSSKKVA